MAVLNGNLYLSLPACKMAQKAKKCNKCQYESCCGLAERNVRLYARGEITPERFQELRADLEGECPIASIYEAWLLRHSRILPLLSNSFKQSRTDRRLAVEEWLRCSYSGAPMT
jgi:hypothetical protein